MLVNIHKLKFLLSILITMVLFTATNAQVWTLQECIDTALVHNKNLAISKNGILIGDQKHKEATANLIPKINAIADYKYYTDQPYQLMPATVFGGTSGTFKEAQFGVPHNINTTLQLTMPIYNPQVYGAIKTTKIASEITELQYEKTEEQVYFEVSNLYYNAQILAHQLIFVDSNLVNTSKLLQNIQLLKEQILAKGTDVNKVQLQLAQLSTQKELIRSKYEQVMNALKFTMGVPFNQIIQIDEVIRFQSRNDHIATSTVDFRVAEAQKRLLLSELNTLRFSLLPTISIYGTFGKTGFGYDKKPNDFLKFYPIGFAGIQLSYPLFNGTVTKRKINQKKIEIHNSDLQLGLITEQNNMQVENARQQKIVAQKSVETTQIQISQAQTIYTQTLLQQKEGTASLTEVLLADNALREAQQTYLSAIIDYLKADLELKKLTGNISTISN
ncbi:MAG: TolC family protein [Bacteroidales bacterium]